jgi:hypothetical protein
VSGDDLRSLYEAAVSGLQARVTAMRHAGAPAKEIAHVVHAERRRLAAHFKQRTPDPLRAQIYRRTLAVYGDPLGPTIEHLRARGRSWDDIIDSATRPGSLPHGDFRAGPAIVPERVGRGDQTAPPVETF